MGEKLQQQLKDVGSKLESPPASKDDLIKLLKKVWKCLADVDQSPSPSTLESMKACVDAIAQPVLLKHQDKEVNVLVASCVCEITRITAPEAPYSDETLRDMFHLIVGTFGGLSATDSPLFGKIVLILETLAKYRSCVMMLDLECDDLIIEMFNSFFNVISNEHAEIVLKSMQTVMLLILEESEDIPENLLFTILSVLGRKKEASLAAKNLAMSTIEQCASMLEPSVKQFFISIMSGENTSSSTSIDYYEIMHNIYKCAPQILDGVIPYVTGELLSDNLDVRLNAVKLLGNIFSSSDNPIHGSFRPLFVEFLKRLTDRASEVRISVIDHVKNMLISDSSRPEAQEILSGLCDRLLDYDEQVRVKVVSAIFDIAIHELTSVSSPIIKQVAERIRDKSMAVKKYTVERLAELYKFCCSKLSDGHDYQWIPGKILRCLYDKDFRSEDIESIFCGSLFPNESTVKEKAKLWVTIFSNFDKSEVKALEQLLTQKLRLQQEMQKYLSLRPILQDDEVPDYKKVSGSFRIMSRSFGDPSKAEESFRVLNQMKDPNIWRILTLVLDPSTSINMARASQDEFLNVFGENHSLYDFTSSLYMRCSYLLFNKEYIKEFLSLAVSESRGDAKFLSSCMNLLPILASFCPLLLDGSVEELINLLKEDDDIIKEGAAHVMAKAGGSIREKLSEASSSVDLLLEGLCLEGTRKQAKFSVQALASITKDDGLKSLSVLYKRLVDMLEERTHLPAILQSLGYIAQIAMPIFETREKEIIEFITNILERGSKTQKKSKQTADWNERSELCSQKIFAIKTLVRSYLPANDALLRSGIKNLFGILKNILSFGEVSNSIKSSDVDKSHLRLASAKAVLRLSRLWESQVPADLFHLTLGTSQDVYPECRKLFLSKVHQYIKERHLDPKYTCAFFYNVVHSEPESLEEHHDLLEIFQVCNAVKARQIIMQSDTSLLTAYPEYALVYLVHALAHHPKFPDIEKYKGGGEFDPFYRRLSLFLSLLLQGNENLKSPSSTDKTKSSLSTLISIFQSIKRSEDNLTKEKSKNSHALCDLGLFIIKNLHNELVDLDALTKSVSLPEQIYKTLETGDENGEVEKWAHQDKVLAHFESLEQAKKKKLPQLDSVDQEKPKEPKLLDEEEAELPLGEIMKIFKSRSAKKRKMTMKQENDIDVLSMVREINLDNQGASPDADEGKQTKEGSPLSLSSEVSANKRKSLERANGAHVGLTRKKPELDSTPISKQKGSIGALKKCSSEKSKVHGVDLVGSRIKVWWPLDKKFYGGKVVSFDQKKSKHEIIYDDGDVEFLLLDKERWEIDSSLTPEKKAKLGHSLSNEKRSTGRVKRARSEDISKKRKKVKRSRTKGRDLSESDSRDDLDRHQSGSEVDNGDSGSGGETTEEHGENSSAAPKGGDDSENEPLSVWRRRAAKSR